MKKTIPTILLMLSMFFMASCSGWVIQPGPFNSYSLPASDEYAIRLYRHADCNCRQPNLDTSNRDFDCHPVYYGDHGTYTCNPDLDAF
jgi:hypothetical protein